MKNQLVLKKGDITAENVDVIVNAANNRLAGGGGVDGAIHKAGGPLIMEECLKIGGCKTGEAVLTTAGNLKASYVVHTVGPIWRGGGHDEEEMLKSAYQKSLERCEEVGAKTVAFPSISTGIYGYPVEEAAHVALATISDFLQQGSKIEEVRMILFSDEDLAIYQKVFDVTF